MKELNVKDFIKKYSGSEVDFFRFKGNYGDSVIWHGTMKLLSDLNIQIHNVELSSKIKNEVLFIDGGGNFIDYYDDVRNFLHAKHTEYKEIVILPHTIFGDKQIDLLSKLKNTTIFCRELESEKFVREHAKNCGVYLSHDCAFYNIFENKQDTGEGVLQAFREDCESIFSDKPVQNIDISDIGGYETKPLDEFLDIISKHKEIHTDRLHVAITASMLGKKVTLYPNSYFKNKAVFDYSLKKYPKTQFITKNVIRNK